MSITAHRPLTVARSRQPVRPAARPVPGPDNTTLIYIGGKASASAPAVGFGRMAAANVAKQGVAGMRGIAGGAATAVGVTALVATATSLGVNGYRYAKGQIARDAFVEAVAGDALGSLGGAAGAMATAALLTTGLTMLGATPVIAAIGTVFAGAFGYGLGERTLKRTGIFQQAVAGIKAALS